MEQPFLETNFNVMIKNILHKQKGKKIYEKIWHQWSSAILTSNVDRLCELIGIALVGKDLPFKTGFGHIHYEMYQFFSGYSEVIEAKNSFDWINNIQNV